jgi:putative ABC transport system permease protein
VFTKRIRPRASFARTSQSPRSTNGARVPDTRTRFLDGQHEQPVHTMGVSPAFFVVLGVSSMLGSGFRAESEYTRDTRRELVISYAAWQRLYGRDSAVIGRLVRFADDDDPHRIVGVMPEGFEFDTAVDFWQPFFAQAPGGVTRTWRYDRVIARLRSGATIEQSRAELETIAARLAREFPTYHGGWTVTVESLHASIVGDFARISWLLLATVSVVLAVTYLNVGGLLVARSAARQRDAAVRAALGAAGWHLVRLRLAEALLLGGTGTALGVGVAWIAVTTLKVAAPPGIPRLDEVSVDVRTLTVATLSALLAVLIVTLAPGRATRDNLGSGLRGAAPGAGGNRSWHTARMVLTVAQCAGAAALVVVSMLLTRSFIRLISVDLGWQPDGVLSLKVSPPMPRQLGRPWFRYVEWSDRLVARLANTPGIERAAITTQVPLAPQPYPSTVSRGRGKAGGDQGRWPAIRHNVSDAYFETMTIRLIAGRAFSPADRFSEPQVNRSEAVERGVAVVSETTARTLWPGESAIGKSLWLPDIDNVRWREVVGVVEDIQFQSVGEVPGLHVFVPWTQTSTGNPRLLVKATADAASVIPLVRRVVEEIERGTRIEAVAPMDTLYAAATAQPRFTMRLVGAFGTLALLLASVGIYGTLSYLVSTRRREIGIRLALGAKPSAVLATVLRRGAFPALCGGVLGVAAAVAVARVFRALLFEIDPLDPVSVATGGFVLMLAALVAALAPARRAARVDPTVALRSE